LISDPFKPGGQPDASNPGVTCPTRVKTKFNWYNPCAFANPASPTLISPGPNNGSYTSPQPGYTYPAYVTDTASAIALLGGRRNIVHGPGFERVNTSISKSFPIWREQQLKFRADIFNLFNTPTYVLSNQSDSSIGGLSQGPQTLVGPDARYVQLSAKYVF
jgi:hypothetical protein